MCVRASLNSLVLPLLLRHHVGLSTPSGIL